MLAPVIVAPVVGYVIDASGAGGSSPGPNVPRRMTCGLTRVPAHWQAIGPANSPHGSSLLRKNLRPHSPF